MNIIEARKPSSSRKRLEGANSATKQEEDSFYNKKYLYTNFKFWENDSNKSLSLPSFILLTNVFWFVYNSDFSKGKKIFTQFLMLSIFCLSWDS